MYICSHPSNLPTHNKGSLLFDNINAKHFQNFDFKSFTDNTMSVLHSCGCAVVDHVGLFCVVQWWRPIWSDQRADEPTKVNSLNIGTLQIEVGNLLQHEVPGSISHKSSVGKELTLLWLYLINVENVVNILSSHLGPNRLSNWYIENVLLRTTHARSNWPVWNVQYDWTNKVANVHTKLSYKTFCQDLSLILGRN